MKKRQLPDPDTAMTGHQAEEFIRLDQFLKVQQLVHSGGAAKWIIQDGQVRVNGQIEERRGRKLYHGDEVEFDARVIPVVFEAD